MGRYIIRRLLWAVVLLFAVSLVTFAIFYLFPSGDPAAMRAGKAPSPGTIAQIRHNLGLDKPWFVQYFLYMKDVVLHFRFGYSYQFGQPVETMITQRLPATISLMVGAVVVWLATGLPIGIISAIKRRSMLDRTTMVGALTAISAPPYWLGLIALNLFASDIGIIKLFPGASSYTGLTANPWHWFTSLIMPWCVLATAFAAFYARLMRSNLIDTMSEDYIRTARAKGLPERRVVLRHGVRASITPVVTALGLDVGILLGGAVLIENVFNIKGLGWLLYNGIENSDIPTVQGTVLFAAFFIVILNLIVDVAYAFLDPRVRYE